jgi:hypothetical protein
LWKLWNLEPESADSPGMDSREGRDLVRLFSVQELELIAERVNGS